MAVTIKPLILAKYAENAQTTQYTASNVRTTIDKFTGTNVTSSNATITVNIVPNGGTAGTGNAVTYTRTIAPNESYGFPELVGHHLEPGGFISTLAGTASAIVIRASGREVT